MYSLDELLCIKVREISNYKKEELLSSISFWIKRFREMQENDKDILMRTRRQEVINTLLELERIINFMYTQKAS